MGRIPGPVPNIAEYVSGSEGNPAASGKANKASERERTHEKYALGSAGMQGGKGRGDTMLKP